MLAIQTTMTATKTNILIVDDQIDNLRTLAAMLSQRGYKVRKAVSGEVALETTQLDPPSLILLDIRMPKMNGYEVCTALKQSPQTSDIPVIFLSALDDTSDKSKAFAVGGADYITKPFQAEEVLLRVQHQLAVQHQQQQLQQEIQERRYAEEILRLQLKREHLLKSITSYIRETVKLDEILEKTVREVRGLLDVDRVLICQFTSEGNLEVVAESVLSPQLSLLGQAFPTPCSRDDWEYFSQDDSISIIESTQNASFSEDYINALIRLQVNASLMFPIHHSDTVWGFLIAHHCTNTRIWEQWEIEMLQCLTVQLDIAVRQFHLYQAVQIQVNDFDKLNQLKNELLDTVFHELRTPIANIKLITRLLMTAIHQRPALKEESSKPKIRESRIIRYLEILQSECEHELQLIQDLLDLHHLETGTQSIEPVPIDLKYWIPHIAEPFEPRMRHQEQTLCLQLDPALPLIGTSCFYLSRILTELVNNACKYTPAGQTITIAAHVEEGMLHLSVTNTGVEIPAEEYASIFNQFYRIRTYDFWKSGGTGMGLTLVRRLAENLNGSIQVTSANQQTCFTVKLPVEST